MEYVICYDIADDDRRSRLAKTLLDYGPRIQESVFLVHLDEELHARMLHRIHQVIEETADRVHVFALCASCEKRAINIGQNSDLPDDPPFLIV
jgi:CRISPR-associated protein Cas2